MMLRRYKERAAQKTAQKEMPKSPAKKEKPVKKKPTA